MPEIIVLLRAGDTFIFKASRFEVLSGYVWIYKDQDQVAVFPQETVAGVYRKDACELG